ncbi:MAG: hypothetical protein H8E40_01025 [Chloroflexi bacterium]|nr:hypothetical protein [Chloroflexota bacterium]
MAKSKSEVVQGVMVSRRNLIELLVIAVLLATGLHLITSAVIELIIPFANVGIGVLFCLGAFAYLVIRLLGSRFQRRSYEAFLIYDRRKNELIPLPRYEFSGELCEYLHGALAENRALRTLWDKEPLKDLSPADSEEEGATRRQQRSANLLTEAIEYFILNKLSIHLTAYFVSQKFKEENLKTYGREDLPQVLLRNRFLELFSRPMEDREAFVDRALTQERYREARDVHGPGGAIYHRFDLTLPKGSAVRRPEGRVEIETKKFKISLAVHFEAYQDILPTGFEQFYLGIDDSSDTIDYKAYIDITVGMRFWTLLTASGWEYYRWIDTFLDQMDTDVSMDTYFEAIDWESTFTLLQCLDRKEARAKHQKAR